jgi:hypothetical protein
MGTPALVQNLLGFGVGFAATWLVSDSIFGQYLNKFSARIESTEINYDAEKYTEIMNEIKAQNREKEELEDIKRRMSKLEDPQYLEMKERVEDMALRNVEEDEEWVRQEIERRKHKGLMPKWVEYQAVKRLESKKEE